MTYYATSEQARWAQREAWRLAMRHDNGCAFSQTRRAALLIGASIALAVFAAVIWVVIHI